MDYKGNEPLELHVDSPGGEVIGVAEAAKAIYEMRDRLVCYIHGCCCSAAYWLCVGAKQLILCSPTTIVGSIGIKITHIDNSKLLETQGVKVTELSTGGYKVMGSENKPLTDKDIEEITKQMNSLYELFVSHVSMCRNLDKQAIIDLQGKEFIGLESIKIGLTDKLLGDISMDFEKENAALKLEIEELKKKIAELVAQLEPEPAEEPQQEVVAKAERHRILALMSLNKGETNSEIVREAIAKGWDYNACLDAITAKLGEKRAKLKAASQVVPLGEGASEKVLASMIAKGAK